MINFISGLQRFYGMLEFLRFLFLNYSVGLMRIRRRVFVLWRVRVGGFQRIDSVRLRVLLDVYFQVSRIQFDLLVIIYDLEIRNFVFEELQVFSSFDFDSDSFVEYGGVVDQVEEFGVVILEE